MATNPFAIPNRKTKPTGQKNPFGLACTEIIDITTTTSSSFFDEPIVASNPWESCFDTLPAAAAAAVNEKKTVEPIKNTAKVPEIPAKPQQQQQKQVDLMRYQPVQAKNPPAPIAYHYQNSFITQEDKYKQEQDQQLDEVKATSEKLVQNAKAKEFDPDNEPPLLVELDIDIESIRLRTLSVLLFKKCDAKLLKDPDLSGPIIIGFLLGFLLLLRGKLHFGYIYGFGVSGTLIIYVIMNFMNKHKEIPLYNTLSILGYCLIPVVLLSLFHVFFGFRTLLGVPAVLSIIWSTHAATTFFVELLGLDRQKLLVGYPIFLFYSLFVLLTIF